MAKPNPITQQILETVHRHGADHVAVLNNTYQLYLQMGRTLEENIAGILTQQLLPPNELQLKLQQLETEKTKLVATLATFQHENNRLKENNRALNHAREKTQLALGDVALHLARASKLRLGDEDEIRTQLKSKGLQDDIIELVLTSTGFMEELGQYISPRRSSRK
jgi:hypothetical protein